MSALHVLVRAWTLLYTCALPPEIRDRRCAEIESDVWESERDPDVSSRELLFRALKGMPADLLWRLEATPGPERARAIVSAVGMVCVLTVTVWAFVRQPLPPPKVHQRTVPVTLRLMPPPPPPRP